MLMPEIPISRKFHDLSVGSPPQRAFINAVVWSLALSESPSLFQIPWIFTASPG